MTNNPNRDGEPSLDDMSWRELKAAIDKCHRKFKEKQSETHTAYQKEVRPLKKRLAKMAYDRKQQAELPERNQTEGGEDDDHT